ncbi:hypothetical protein [Psychroserpens algicola]|uniref:hypothetical protein n=1 Tax=Psychroserpens algicola TaxID=1719034 RepID=UPI001F230436|nr:hypothetical protein [Psychroserpens algicola]
MKIRTIIMTTVCAALISSCNIDQKKEAELPSVDVDMDVSAEEGQLPTFDVDWADVNVGTTTKTVKVPKVVIVMEEEEIEVPYIDVDMPEDDNADYEKEERNILIEAEVTDNEHTLDIKEILASNNNLYVISELKSTNQTIGDKKMRVSDQLTLNARDLNVKHYIIGERPDRVFNTQHTYVKNMDELKSKIKGDYKVIYSK